MAAREISVVLIDDHPVVRSGLRAVLDAQPDVTVVGEAGSVAEAIALLAECVPDVAVCDLRLGDGDADGVEVIRATDRPVVILSTYDRPRDVRSCLEAGARGYVVKDAPIHTIVEALHAVAAGGTYVQSSLAATLIAPASPAPDLTQREVEVLELLATGASNKEISKQLFISQATTKTHLVHIFSKLGVDSRTRAVHVARSRGIIS